MTPMTTAQAFREYRHIVKYVCPGCMLRWTAGRIRRPRYWVCLNCETIGEATDYLTFGRLDAKAREYIELVEQDIARTAS